MKINGQIIVSKQWQKDNKRFVTFEMSILGMGVAKFTTEEQNVPDIIEGKVFSVDLIPSLYNGKFNLKPDFKTWSLQE